MILNSKWNIYLISLFFKMIFIAFGSRPVFPLGLQPSEVGWNQSPFVLIRVKLSCLIWAIIPLVHISILNRQPQNSNFLRWQQVNGNDFHTWNTFGPYILLLVVYVWYVGWSFKQRLRWITWTGKKIYLQLTPQYNTQGRKRKDRKHINCYKRGWIIDKHY